MSMVSNNSYIKEPMKYAASIVKISTISKNVFDSQSTMTSARC